MEVFNHSLELNILKKVDFNEEEFINIIRHFIDYINFN